MHIEKNGNIEQKGISWAGLADRCLSSQSQSSLKSRKKDDISRSCNGRKDPYGRVKKIFFHQSDNWFNPVQSSSLRYSVLFFLCTVVCLGQLP